MNLSRSLMLSVLALGASLLVPSLLAVPAEIAYQGRLTNDDVNADGPFQFAFSLIADGLKPAWHHDGTAVGLPMPLLPLTLTVTNGHFAVRLGDTTVPNMVALDPALFAVDTSLALRVWVRETAADPWEQLTPDTPLSSAPYALYAHAAGSVPTGAVDTSQLVDESVTAPKLALSAVGTSRLADDAVTSAKIDDGTIGLIDLNLASLDSRYVPTTGGTFTGAVTFGGGINLPGAIEAGTDLSAGEDVYVNFSGPEGDGHLYFYDQSSSVNEYLRWDDADDRFVLSDDLYVHYGLTTGSTVTGQSVISNGNFYANYNGPDGNAYIYFYEGSPTAEYLRWDDSNARFYLSDDLDVLTLRSRGDIYVNHNGPDGTDGQIFFFNGNDEGEYIEWDDSEERFEISEDTQVWGNLRCSNLLHAPHIQSEFHLYANYDGPASDNASVFFYDVDSTDEYLRWMNAEDYFRFSDDLAVQGTISEISDARLKTAVEPLPYGLAETLRLRPVAFRWDVAAFPGQDAATSRQIGLLAQEVAAVIPESVAVPAEEDGFYNLSYTDLVPVLIKAVQEQQAQIEALQTDQATLATIQAQAAQIAGLEAEVAALKDAVAALQDASN